ncbi:hypothetical protein Cadr_000006727 [Camelus dromedarius]|uniref:Uncharacterized protein n=1 Tax=Camelus dromedarius TaxID=9838 RepID=A0A5N4E5J9_CAMDR|nr:hypothetical protein Cadr_000006727 [Camelus dromedarius]
MFVKDDKTTGVAPREPHLEFQQDPECDEMHFLIPLSIHQTRMEPGTSMKQSCKFQARVVTYKSRQDFQWAQLVQNDEEEDPRKVRVLGDMNAG